MSHFSIDLTNLKMSPKQIESLNQELRATTIKFLVAFPEGKEFLDNSVEFKPDPNGPVPFPRPPYPWPIPRPPFPFPPYPGFFPLQKDILKQLDKQLGKINIRL